VALKCIPGERLIDLHRRLETLPSRSGERRSMIQEFARLYGVSEATLYRALRQRLKPRAMQRSDRGIPRVMPSSRMERYCEIIAAIKIRTSNKKGRHLSTAESIRLLEEFGITTPDGFVQAPKSLLNKSTVNRYLKQWGYDQLSLNIQPAAVRFQARHSNDCWQFDLSPSDLKQVKKPIWVKEEKGNPTLMLYSAVDDRSGVAYCEYHCVYGEDVEAALRFLFNAMSPKKVEGFAFEGIPDMIYMDNGPIARSHVFHQVMKYLGVNVKTHLPRGKDGRRVTARAKGKVERPFRTVKEMYETLFHLYEPETELEANAGLMRFLKRYNSMRHRIEPHSRLEDWIQNLPPSGIRKMCSWERFCTFARDPERRKVGGDARVTVNGVTYEVDPEVAGQEVILWWGVFDSELYVEHGQARYGPYRPIGGPIPLHKYRKFKKTKAEQRADRIEALSAKLILSKAAVLGNSQLSIDFNGTEKPAEPFNNPDPFDEFNYPNIITAKKAISDFLGMPLARLNDEQLSEIDSILSASLNKSQVMEKIREYFEPSSKRG
jgi:hypothetical protein